MFRKYALTLRLGLDTSRKLEFLKIFRSVPCRGNSCVDEERFSQCIIAFPDRCFRFKKTFLGGLMLVIRERVL
jgi:hypothetical protein